MTAVYRLPLSSTFSSSRTCFEGLIERVQAEETMNLPHDDVEAMLKTEGRELLRRLFQDHLDLRALREAERAAPTGSDGVERNHRRGTSRPLRTIFGDADVHRLSFTTKKAAGGLRPLDAELNLPVGLFSFGVHLSACVLAMDVSFDSTCDKMARLLGVSVPKRQLEGLVVRSAQDFDAFYDSQQEKQRESAGDSDDLLIMSTDGKGIVMRTDSLREATRRNAEKAKHKLEARLSPGEKRNRKRMAEVATVYEMSRRVRSPKDIIASNDADEERSRRPSRPKVKRKRVWASIDKSLKEVVEQVFDEALSRDPHKRRTWVYLVDGNKDQIRVAKRLARKHGVELVIIIDFIHVLEYLWKAAWSFFDKGDPKVEAWVLDRARRVLEGKAGTVAAGIRRSATLRKLDKKARVGADACAKYLRNKKSMLRYDLYLASGMPIATGVIEGACRHLVNDRLGITGARWGLAGAEAMLRLRALRSSGHFDAYWDFHRRQELARNHHSHFAPAQDEELRIAA